MAAPHYSDSLEKLLKQQGEHALALCRAHEDSQRWCAKWNTRLQLPTIILSSLTGFFSATTDMIPQTVLGGVSILVAIIGSIQSYLAFAKRSESHRNSSLSYARIHRLLSTELTLTRAERTPAPKLLEMLKTEIETLSETAPILPMAVKGEFGKHFKGIEGYALPPSLNGLDPIQIAPEPPAAAETPATPARPDVKVRILEV